MLAHPYRICYIENVKGLKGQNLIEYILLVTMVILVCIFFFTTGPMQQTVNNSIYGIVNMINSVNAQVQFP